MRFNPGELISFLCLQDHLHEECEVRAYEQAGYFLMEQLGPMLDSGALGNDLLVMEAELRAVRFKRGVRITFPITKHPYDAAIAAVGDDKVDPSVWLDVDIKLWQMVRQQAYEEFSQQVHGALNEP